MLRFLSLAFVLFAIISSPLLGGEIDAEKIEFIEERNGDNFNANWTGLRFRVVTPKINGSKYLGRNKVTFELHTDRTNRYLRSHLLLDYQFLDVSTWPSTSRQQAYLGDRKISGAIAQDISKLSQDEKKFISWIILNSPSLIRMALDSEKKFATGSRIAWQNALKNNNFQTKTKNAFYPLLTRNYDAVENSLKHSSPELIVIQKALAAQGLYEGAVDGLIGPKTRKAIEDFERANKFFVNAHLSISEYAKLKDVKSGSQSSNLDTTKQVEELQKRLDGVLNVSAKRLEVISNLREEIASLKKASSDNDEVKRLNSRISALQNLADQRQKFIQTLSKKLKDVKSGSQSSNLDTTKQVEELQKRLDGVLNVSAKRLEVISNLREEIASLKKASSDNDEVKRLNSRISALQNLADQRQKFILTLSKKLKDASSEPRQTTFTEELQRSLEAANEVSNNRLKYINELREELRNIKNSISQSDNTKLNKISADNQRLTEIVQAQLEELRALKTDTAKLTEINEQLAGDNQLLKENVAAQIEIKDEFDKLRQKQQSLESENKEITNAYRYTEAKLNSALSEREKQIAQIDQLSKQNRDIFNKFKDAEKQILDLSQRLAASSKLVAEQTEAANQSREIIANLDAKILELEQLKSQDEIESFDFILSDDWKRIERWIPAQQLRFCTILAAYEIKAEEAANSMNQLKQNSAVRERDENMQALLMRNANGQNNLFQNWVAKVEKVFVINLPNNEIGAGVVLTTPCGVTIGSGAMVVEEGARYKVEEFRAVATPDQPIFRQLEQLSLGDSVLINGSFITYDDGNDLTKFVTNVDGIKKKLVESKRPENAPDYFVDISYLSQL